MEGIKGIPTMLVRISRALPLPQAGKVWLLAVCLTVTGTAVLSQVPASFTIMGYASNFGPWGDGTVFSLQSDGSGFQVVRPLGVGRGLDGSYPIGVPVSGGNNLYYGMTYSGGLHGYGTIYAVNQSGSSFSVIHHFQDSTDGSFPRSSLILGLDGWLYGVTAAGGQYSAGTLFKIHPAGSGFTVVHHFQPASEGGNPWGTLYQRADSVLFGMTYRDGVYGGGGIYRVNPDGTGFQVLHQFNPALDGSLAHGALIELPSGYLAGLTHRGGTHDDGTIFSISPNGTGFSVLHHLLDSTDGSRPIGQLLLASDGYLYGLTQYGGRHLRGTCFRILPNGSGFGAIFHFNGTNGDRPQASLAQGPDGLLYGTASQGGATNTGVIFSLSPVDTSYQLLHSFFASTDGGTPTGNLLLLPAANLPVSWASFEAFPGPGTGVMLHWTTSQEQSNTGFQIERSKDGGIFEVIGWQDSQGDSESNQEYAFHDRGVHEGTWHYRLRQVDVNGQMSVSPVRSLSLNVDMRLALFPNPATSEIHLRSALQLRAGGYLDILDAKGALVRSERFPAGRDPLRLAIGELRPGLYVATLRNDQGDIASQRFLKR